MGTQLAEQAVGKLIERHLIKARRNGVSDGSGCGVQNTVVINALGSVTGLLDCGADVHHKLLRTTVSEVGQCSLCRVLGNEVVL